MAWRPVAGGGASAIDRARETYVVSGTLTHAGLTGFQLTAGTSGCTISRLTGPDNAADFDGLVLAAGQELIFGQEITSIRLSAGNGILYNSQERPAQWFVSSHAGDDSNDGLSAGAQLRTISKLMEYFIAAGDEIVLDDDSTFSPSTLTSLQGRDEITIKRSNTGTNKPVFEGRRLVANNEFSLTPSTTSTWEFEWIPVSRNSGNEAQIAGFWQGNRLLERVSTQAEVETTEGSFYYAAIPQVGIAETMYIHPYGSIDPITMGEFWVTSLDTLLILGDDCTLDGLVFRGAFGKDSCSAGLNITARNCEWSHGIQHVFVFNSGIVENCEIGRYRGDGTFFIQDGTNKEFTIRNCTIYGGVPEENLWQADVQAIFNHTADGFPAYESCTIEDCNFINRGEPISVAANNVIVKGCTFERANFINIQAESDATEMNVVFEDNFVSFDASGTKDVASDNTASIPQINVQGSATIRGNRVYANPSSNLSSGVFNLNGSLVNTVLFEYNSLWLHPTGGSVVRGIVSDQDAVFTARNNIIANNNSDNWLFSDTSASLSSTDNNIYTRDKFRLGATTWNNQFATMQAVVSPHEANSVIIADPGFSDPANGDFTTTAPEVEALQAGVEYYVP